MSNSIQDNVQKAIQSLAHINTAQLDTELLLAHVLQIEKIYLHTHPEHTLTSEQEEAFMHLVTERAKHIPIAYLTNTKSFYGKDFYITPDVHIPRPATEDIVDHITQTIPKDFAGTIADIGTGSGIIAITLAHLFPQAEVIAVDVSEKAVAVAQHNAKTHGVEDRITFLKGSLTEPLKKPVDILVANLPYGWKNTASDIPEPWTQDAETLHQPALVYDGGTNGLALIYTLLEQLPQTLPPTGKAWLEYDPRQTALLIDYCNNHHISHSILKDTAGFDRTLYIDKIHQ